MRQCLESQIARLTALRETHLALGKKMLGSEAGLYPLDFFATATLNRSFNLLKGFRLLLESGNFESAVPLVRLQLDNALRFGASWLVDDPHDFAMRVLGGISIRDQKDGNGRRMTDAYLVESLSREYPWLPEVYKHACAHVHLSEKHFFSAIRVGEKEGDAAPLHLKISESDMFIPDQVYVEAVDLFEKASEILFRYIHGWIYTKENPGEVARLRAIRDL